MYKNAVCFGTVRCFRHLSYLVVGLPDFGSFGLRFPFRNSSLSPLFRFLLSFSSSSSSSSSSFTLPFSLLLSPSLSFSLLLSPSLSSLSRGVFLLLSFLLLSSPLLSSLLLFLPISPLSLSSLSPPPSQGFRVLRYESISVPIFSSLLRSSLSTSLLCRMATFAIANFRAAIAR